MLCFILVGFSTDGEFNSLRTMGHKRPISVIEVAKNAKQQAKVIRANVLAGHFSFDRQGM